MNSTQAPTKFILHVSAQSTSNVWPLKSRDNPKLDARIQENYYADEDEANASFTITDMDDLKAIMAFYSDCAVNMTLLSIIEAPEFTASASLDSSYRRGIFGSYKMLEKDAISPATAANKLIALAHAMQRFQDKKPS